MCSASCSFSRPGSACCTRSRTSDPVQQVAALIYAGSTIGAVYAGDLITLFVFWELTAIASVFLIWARRTERAYRAGMRYLIIQVGSGVLLLAGACSTWSRLARSGSPRSASTLASARR